MNQFRSHLVQLVTVLVLAGAACASDLPDGQGANGGGPGNGVTATSDTTVTSAAPSVTASSGNGARGGSCHDAGLGNNCLPACSTVEPVAGSPCDVKYAQCEFSDELEIECRRAWFCNAATCTWQPAYPPSYCGPTSMTACPPSPTGGTCDVAQGCHYADGTLCWCAPGGTTCGDGFPPSAPCPAVAPRLGTPCSNEGINCIYGLCAPNVEGARSCCGGVWGPGYLPTIPC